MPERGWSVLTVREETARKVKEIAQAKGLTHNEVRARGTHQSWAEGGMVGLRGMRREGQDI